MKQLKVSNNVIRRLPRYLRKLDELKTAGVDRISSGELGRQMSLTSSQIRQDFSCFGEFGQQGYGYNVTGLRGEIASILGMNRDFSVILVGVGNIGRALIENFCFEQYGFHMLAAYDVRPELIGTEVTNVVAKSDGIIRRLELVDGYPRVVPGQYVAQGQVLVSGMTLSQYERPLYSHAQAEVLAEVEKSYVYTQPLHVEPVLPQAVSKSYYKLYLPWGELSLYAQLDVPENASQRVLRRPAAPFGFHLPALVEETQVRQAAAVPFDLAPGLAEDIARSRILDAIRAEFGDYELLEETPSAEEADGAVTLTLRVRMLADIGKMVPYEGEAMEPDSTIGADS